MRKLYSILLVELLIIGVFSGVIELNSVDVCASGPLPTADNPKAYCHYEVDGSRLWMNSLQEDSESKDEHTETRVHTTDESWTYGFPLREGPDDDLILESPISFNTSNTAEGWFQVRFELGLYTEQPSDVRIYLMANEVVIGEDTSPEYIENAGSYQFEITLTVDEVNDLNLRITWTEHPGTTTCILDTNGGSFITLPIASETNGDGPPGDDSDQDGDKDSEEDENGFILGAEALILLGVVILAIIIIAIVIRRKRRTE